MLDVAGALGVEAGQEGGEHVGMDFTLEARPRACTVPKGHRDPVNVSSGHDAPVG